MAGIGVTSADLSALTGQEITPAEFGALDRVVRRLLAGAYRGDVDTAIGRHADVLGTVYVSVSVRLLTDPTGLVSSIGLGAAQVALRGTTDALRLTPGEYRDLRALRASRPSCVELEPFRFYAGGGDPAPASDPAPAP